MKLVLRILFGISFILGFSVSQGQNRITVKLDEFTELIVSGRIDLELIPSDSREMTITSLNGNPENVNIDFKENELKISIRPSITKDDEITVKLPYKKLTLIDAAAGAVINSGRNVEAEELELKANSGGKIEISVNANTINAKVNQISDIILYGKVVSQNVTAHTGGNYLAYDLEVQDTYVKVSSGSQAKVRASRIIEATANSKGFIGYIGDPVSTYTKTSLGGEIVSYKTKPDEDLY